MVISGRVSVTGRWRDGSRDRILSARSQRPREAGGADVASLISEWRVHDQARYQSHAAYLSLEVLSRDGPRRRKSHDHSLEGSSGGLMARTDAVGTHGQRNLDSSRRD